MAIVPLGLVLLLHVLLLVLWMRDKPAVSSSRGDQRVLSVFWLPQGKPRAAAPPPTVGGKPVPVRRARPVQGAAGPALPGVAAPDSVAPADTVLAAPADAAPAAAPDAPDTSQMIDMARRQAGAIDQALRGGKLAPLAPARTLPIVRLRSALDSAYIDRSRDGHGELYPGRWGGCLPLPASRQGLVPAERRRGAEPDRA